MADRLDREEKGRDAFEPRSSTAPLSTMQRMIGARLSESKQTAPHFYLSVDFDLEAVNRLRAHLKADTTDHVPTVNDWVLAAVGRALVEVPAINARVEGTRIRTFSQANIGAAVALAGGLVVPVLRSVDEKDLFTISQEMRTLASRARCNKLTPDDYRGGTFTVSNLGMHGVREFIAILNPPQAGILALGMAEKRAVVKDDQVCVATTLGATLSADHRVVNGVAGAMFLDAVRRQLAEPERLLGRPESQMGGVCQGR